MNVRAKDILDAGLVLCIGLFPALHLRSLQLAFMLILIGATLRGLRRAPQRVRLNWSHLAILQFALIFLLNAVLFAPLTDTPAHFRPIAIEAWSTSIVGLGLLWYYLGDGRDLSPVWQHWLPIGLFLAFAIISYEYLFLWDGSGGKVRALAPNSLVPPMWFLVLTLISFANFTQLTRLGRILRFVLLACAAILVMYAGARFVGVAWLLGTLFIIVYLVQLSAQEKRFRLGLSLSGLLILTLLSIYILDSMTAGILKERVHETLHGIQNRSTTFFRLELWSSAFTVISEHYPWGAGQINERTLISAELAEKGHWLRAHQTYLSYLIAGGTLTLVSGLIFQIAPLAILTNGASRAKMPAVIGLIGVTGLNGLTDSVFQSYVSVQIYIVVTLMLAAGKATPLPATPSTAR